MNGYGVRRQAKRDAAFVSGKSGVALRLPPHSISTTRVFRAFALRVSASTVFQNFHRLERYQPASHHLVQQRKEGLNLLLTVDDLDHQRQVHGKPQNLGRVKPAGFAETHRSTEHRCAGQVLLTRFQDNGFVQGFVFPSVTFADEDAEQNGIVWDLHNEGWRKGSDLTEDRIHLGWVFNASPSA